MEEHTLTPARIKLLVQMVNEWGSLVEAVLRVVPQVLGALALIYLVIRAILR
jgi:hypothetical protein